MILAVILSGTAVVSLAACGGRGTEGGGNANVVEPDMSLEETLTIDWLCPTQDTLAVTETPMIQYIEKKFNVQFEVQQQQPSAHDQKVELLISRQEIPTMLTRIPVARANEYGDYGAFLNIEPYLEYMPNFSKIIEQASEENANNDSILYDAEGRIYRVPNYTPNPYPIYNFSYNKAAFAEVGYSEPQTWNEVYEALKALKTKYPNSYPFAVRKTDEGMSLTLNDFVISFTGGYGNSQEFYGYNAETDSFELSLDVDGFKEAIQFFNKIYTEGLVDPEFTSMDGNALLDRVQNKKVFMLCDFNGGFTGYSAEEERTRELYPMHLPSPTDDPNDATYGFRVANFDTVAGTAIDGEIVNDPLLLGRVLQIIDYMYSDEFVNIQWYHPNVTLGSYPEGTDIANADPTAYNYTLDGDGNKQYDPKIYEKANIGDVINNYFNWSVYANFYNMNDPVCDPVRFAPFYEFRSELITNTDKYVDVPTPVLTAREYKQVTAKNSLVKARFEMRINDFLTKPFTDADWEAFVTELKNEGGSELIEIYNEAYGRTLENK